MRLCRSREVPHLKYRRVPFGYASKIGHIQKIEQRQNAGVD
jgi:hypothetical protein